MSRTTTIMSMSFFMAMAVSLMMTMMLTAVIAAMATAVTKTVLHLLTDYLNSLDIVTFARLQFQDRYRILGHGLDFLVILPTLQKWEIKILFD
jgi:hypothetical protein